MLDSTAHVSSVLILGSGEIGRALATLINSSGANVCIWDRTPVKCSGITTLTDAVQKADVIFLCVPSPAVPEVIRQILPDLKSETGVVCLAKGITPGTGLTIDQELSRLLPSSQSWGLLYGPLIAEELMAGKGGQAVVATSDQNLAANLKSFFSKNKVGFEFYEDVHTIALLGVLKNIYAVLLGMASGLDWGANRAGWLISRCIIEMQQVVKILGGDPSLVLTSAGVGDLVATGLSSDSQNHRTGVDIALGHEYKPSEGTRSLPSLLQLIRSRPQTDLPLLEAIENILVEKTAVLASLTRLITTMSSMLVPLRSMTSSFSSSEKVKNEESKITGFQESNIVSNSLDALMLVIDVGTTGVKACLFSRDLKLLKKSYLRLEKHVSLLGWVEQSPHEILEKSRLVARQVLEGVTVPVLAMGLTNQRETVVAWDKKTGQAVTTAIVWEDERTKDECLLLNSQFGQEVRERTGLPILPYFSASKISWLLKNNLLAAQLASTGSLAIGTLDSWLLWHWLKKNPETNQNIFVTDTTNAARTLLFDIQTQGWSERLGQIFEVPSNILSKTQSSISHFGSTNESVFGKSLSVEVVCGDQQASCAIAEMEPGMTKVTYGTGTFVVQVIGAQFQLFDSWFTTLLPSSSSQVLYGVEAKVGVYGQRVQALLDSGEDLIPIWKEISSKVAYAIAKCPIKPREVWLDGGMSQNDDLARIQSETLGLRVKRQSVFDGTALGVAKMLWESFEKK